jgi:DNA-binding XRE family transcriptional regulator
LQGGIDHLCNAQVKLFYTSYKLFTAPAAAGEKLGMSGRRARRAKESLAANVVRLRCAREMKQTELAMKARVTQALISAVELGQANPTLESLYRIAQALGVGIEDLFATVRE